MSRQITQQLQLLKANGGRRCGPAMARRSSRRDAAIQQDNLRKVGIRSSRSLQFHNCQTMLVAKGLLRRLIFEKALSFKSTLLHLVSIQFTRGLHCKTAWLIVKVPAILSDATNRNKSRDETNAIVLLQCSLRTKLPLPLFNPTS